MEQVALHSSNHTISIFCDLSKAFDCVNHSILLSKLNRYGVRGIALDWFHSYLSNRLQYTSITKSSPHKTGFKLTERKSSLEPVKSGVPQGSILGPLLFNLYINDLPLNNDCASYILYADDTNIILSANDPSSLVAKMNFVLSNTMSWFNNNHLSLNLEKTSFMCLNSKHKPDLLPYVNHHSNVEFITETKFLGIIITSDLSWNSHILYVAKKIKPGIAMLYKLRDSLPTSSLLQIYFSLIHSHLSYAILIWGSSPHTHISKLLKLQKKAIRILSNKSPRTSCRPLFKHYNILTVTSLYILEASNFAKKISLTPQ